MAEKFGEAAKTYANDPVAFHLRAMNILYEGLKQNSTIVIVPSTAVDSMQLGGLAGLTALTMGLGQEHARREIEGERLIANGSGKVAAIGSDPSVPGNGVNSNHEDRNGFSEHQNSFR